MSKILDTLSQIWNFLDGKKTVIAAAYWTVITPVLLTLFPQGMPLLLLKVHTAIGTFLGAIGLGHKSIKKNTTE